MFPGRAVHATCETSWGHSVLPAVSVESAFDGEVMSRNHTSKLTQTRKSRNDRSRNWVDLSLLLGVVEDPAFRMSDGVKVVADAHIMHWFFATRNVCWAARYTCLAQP